MSDRARELVLQGAEASFDDVVEKCFYAGLSFSDYSRAAKRAYILWALEVNKGNMSAAARSLGMHRNTLHRNLHELGIHNQWGRQYHAA